MKRFIVLCILDVILTLYGVFYNNYHEVNPLFKWATNSIALFLLVLICIKITGILILIKRQAFNKALFRRVALIFTVIVVLWNFGVLLVSCTPDDSPDDNFYFKNLYSYNGTSWFKIISGNGTQGIQGIQGEQGEKGDKGDTGPNELTSDTETNLTGVIYGNGSNVGTISLTPADVGLNYGARIYTTTSQTDNYGFVWRTLTYEHENYDNGGFHSTSTNTSQLVVPVNGVYLIIAFIYTNNHTSNDLLARIDKNDTSQLIYAEWHYDFVWGGYGYCSFSTLATLVAGDYVEVLWYDPGGHQDLNSCWFAIQKES